MYKASFVSALLLLSFSILPNLVAALTEYTARLIGDWNGSQIVQKGSRFFKLKNAAGDLEELSLPGASQILGLATGSSPMALVLRQGRLQLLTQAKNKKWVAQLLPLKQVGKSVQLLANEHNAVLIDSNRVFRVKQGTCEEIVPKTTTHTKYINSAFRFDQNPSWLLKDNFLYRGVNGGEWAGGLFELDLDKSVWEPVVGAGSLRVIDLRLGPNGKILAAGIKRKGIQRDSVVLTVSRSGDKAEVESNKSATSGSGFSPNPAFYYSVDFDSQGSAYYLTPEGIVTLKNGKWVALTNNWQKYSRMNPTQFKLLKGTNKALLSTDNEGLLVVDLNTP